MVDAGEDEVWQLFFFGEERVECDFHAIDWGSAAGIYFDVGFFCDFCEVEGLGHGDGVRHTALASFRGDGDDTAPRFEGVNQGVQAFSVDTVVVG